MTTGKGTSSNRAVKKGSLSKEENFFKQKTLEEGYFIDRKDPFWIRLKPVRTRAGMPGIFFSFPAAAANVKVTISLLHGEKP
ncbi:MAG TPA: hypothetical protein PL090_02010 [Syntrophales bacterium]|nr:hypothetical protein [Syntrophales bacterium]